MKIKNLVVPNGFRGTRVGKMKGSGKKSPTDTKKPLEPKALSNRVEKYNAVNEIAHVHAEVTIECMVRRDFKEASSTAKGVFGRMMGRSLVIDMDGGVRQGIVPLPFGNRAAQGEPRKLKLPEIEGYGTRKMTLF